MANKWLQHLNSFRRANRNVDAKDMMKEARKTYRGGSASGSSVVPYVPNNLASTASTLKGGKRKSRRQTKNRSRRTRSR
jgi:hypothetical protein